MTDESYQKAVRLLRESFVLCNDLLKQARETLLENDKRLQEMTKAYFDATVEMTKLKGDKK
jgi:hypothetical protein